MDEAGVEKVFVTQCKMWSYWRKWMYMGTQLEEVLQYTEKSHHHIHLENNILASSCEIGACESPEALARARLYHSGQIPGNRLAKLHD